MCPVLIRYKTTKVFVINNLDFGSISTGVGLSILISNLSKKRGFFADFLFYQLSLVCFYHLHIRECVRAGAQTRRSLGDHLLHPLILRLLVLCAPAVLRPKALQDAPAPADPNS